MNLSSLPVGWRVARLGFLVETHVPQRDKPDPLNGPIPWVRIEDFDGQEIRVSKSGQGVTAEQVADMNLRVLSPGTVLCSCSCSMGATAIVREPLVSNQTFIGLTPGPEVESRFLLYLMHAMRDRLQALATGAIQQYLSRDDFRALRVPLPSLAEQRRIADFLDSETARIDKLRELRAQQLALLTEAAVCRVYNAVRGGSVAGARKDSGLNWLGSVPESWRVAAVSHFFDVELGKMLNEERSTGDHLRPYLRVANVQWDHIDIGELAMMNFPPNEQSRYRLREGDLLVNEGGSWPGRAAIWTHGATEMYYQKALHRIRPRTGELPRWLYYCLVVAERVRVFQVQGNTSTMTHLTREQLRPQRFPFPDKATQAALVAELDAAAERDKGLQGLLRRQLALFAERRQALITAAVTGQFDVSTASGRNVTEGITA
ncbi:MULTISPECIES: restriction endonuclease subunit S [unclassified Streptomyces]|uniref:restriction endonuclease subunit S n=1 Tax=unclassified Streptomyces TaxID=2593676 RepID=UPI002967518A|nr:restriction endonuclease subunit S [Streptomyces sp. SJL17-1]